MFQRAGIIRLDCAEFVISASKSCDYPQISFVIHHNILKRAHWRGWNHVRTVESSHRIRSAELRKWLSEPMSRVSKIIGWVTTFLNPALDKKETPEKSRLFNYSVAVRLNDSHKDSIPFQSSPYVCIKDNNRHTGA